MDLILSPIRMDAPPLTASVVGDVLTLNGAALDFSALANGAQIEAEATGSAWIAGAVTRDAGGVLTVLLLFPIGPDAPEESRYPVPITATGGAVNLPPYSASGEA
jgi:hypothetical protein